MAAVYSFVSRWTVPASRERCWRELERLLRPDGSASWWRAVTLIDAPGALREGERMTLAVRSPLGYRLRVRLTVTDVAPGERVVAESDGDLRGSGSIEIEAQGADAASIVFHWNVATERRWMNASAFVLRPVFERAHASVMRAGERGLSRALEG